MLEVFPLLLALPLGWLYGDFLLFSATCALRKQVRIMAKVLRDAEVMPLSSERRSYWAKESADCLKEYRRGITYVDSLKQLGPLLRVILAKHHRALDEFGEYAETFALGADPEVDRLAKELSDVL